MERKRTPRLVDLAGADAAQQQGMLEVHAFTTANSIKVLIAPEEMGLGYRRRLTPSPQTSTHRDVAQSIVNHKGESQ